MNAPSVAISASFDLSSPSSVSSSFFVNDGEKLVKDFNIEVDKTNNKTILVDNVNKFYINTINQTIFLDDVYDSLESASSKIITIQLDFLDFKENQKEAHIMKYHLNGLRSAENGLFYIGIFTGLFILSSAFIADVPLYNAIPASLFGFGAMIPKIRGILNGK